MHDVQLIPRRGFSHRARFRLHANEVSKHDRQFRLAVRFEQLETGQFEEAVVDFRVQRLARDSAVLERGRSYFFPGLP